METKVYLDGTLFVSLPMTEVSTDKLKTVLVESFNYSQFLTATVDFDGQTDDGYEVRFISPNKKLG